jgi:AraC family transcriptional regulator
MTGEEKVTLHIKNMVCDRCIRVVREELERIGLKVESISLGEAEVIQPMQPVGRERISEVLEASGFALLEDRRTRLVERIKAEIIQAVRRDAEEDPLDMKFSDYLASRLNMDYSYLSSIFSAAEGITIEQYIIQQKIERAKELLQDGDLNLSEIAYKLGYSSVQHLSGQFKKVAGMTASRYRQEHSGRRPLDKVS